MNIGSQEPAVALRGVSKSYGCGNAAVPVLKQVDLVVQRGECVFLLGPSGSGKTTLLSIIGCVLSADNGEVSILGRSVKDLDVRECAELRLRRLGFLFQRFNLIRGLSAAENVAVPLTLAGWPARDAARRACELLAHVGLADKARVEPYRLSMGQCQRVALARALAGNPDLVLADEPTASLDARTGSEAMELLTRLTVEVGKTIVVVTHDLRILPFADRALRLENGALELCAAESEAPRADAAEPVVALTAAH